jgi:transcriptional regulator of acetoin/glycerol metabolism
MRSKVATHPDGAEKAVRDIRLATRRSSRRQKRPLFSYLLYVLSPKEYQASWREILSATSSSQPPVVVNCAAFTDTLLESELFKKDQNPKLLRLG